MDESTFIVDDVSCILYLAGTVSVKILFCHRPIVLHFFFLSPSFIALFCSIVIWFYDFARHYTTGSRKSESRILDLLRASYT
jgi:hypothetical protein